LIKISAGLWITKKEWHAPSKGGGLLARYFIYPGRIIRPSPRHKIVKKEGGSLRVMGANYLLDILNIPAG
jgi:hypothetical protein